MSRKLFGEPANGVGDAGVGSVDGECVCDVPLDSEASEENSSGVSVIGDGSLYRT
jgi:hypothetical protein